jgi:hypothetical protein
MLKQRLIDIQIPGMIMVKLSSKHEFTLQILYRPKENTMLKGTIS